MKPGELLVVKLKGGTIVARYLEPGRREGKILVSAGPKRTAEIPKDRVILATGSVASSDDEFAGFQHQAQTLAAEVDLAETWEVVREETGVLGLQDLAELFWGPSHSPAQLAAILLYLDREPLYFTADQGGFQARSQEAVEERQARRKREEENARDIASLIEHLSQGTLPQEPTRHQSMLVEHLRGYAVHGDNYTRSTVARGLLESVDSGTRDYQRLSFDLLVATGVFSPDEPLELEREEIPQEFPEDALVEASTIDQAPLLAEPGRRDLTQLASLTIDDAGTQDRDDALSLEVEHTGGEVAVYRVGIHIADAGALIPHGGAIDIEADRRMATLYTPDRKVPMLPAEISDRSGSLVSGEPRVALSLLVQISESGEVLDWEVTPSSVLSDVSITYEEADAVIADEAESLHETLAQMDRLASALRQRREKAGALVLERPEMMIKLTPSGEVAVTVIRRATPARQLVAEMMILCNTLLAEFCQRESLPAAYRVQATPDLSDIDVDADDGPLHQYRIIRRLQPADIDIIPAAHGGLGVPAYIQATSPLRRYPDLIMQRQISSFLRSGSPLYSEQEVASVAQRAEVQLRELRRLEEDRKRYWFLKFLQQTVRGTVATEDSDLFQSVVLDNRPRRPALLELTEYPFKFRAGLPEQCSPGDTVTLRLRGVDLWQRTSQFVHERSGQPSE